MKKFLLLLTVMLGFAWQSNAQIDWSYDESTSTLTISGTGDMGNYSAFSKPDWLKNAEAKNATSLVIEEGVTSVGNCTFYNMAKLTEVVIPASVESIGDKAFLGCYVLVNIKWQGTTIDIADAAFKSIASNASVIYSAGADITSWKAVGLECKLYVEGTFEYNSNEFTYKLDGDVLSFDGTGVLGGTNGIHNFTNLLNNANQIIINEGITEIVQGTFVATGNCKVTSIELPSTLTSVEEKAFELFNKVTSLTIPAALTEINPQAFYNFSSLSNIDVEDGNAAYDSRNSCNAIIRKVDNTLVLGSTATTVIPTGVTSIGDYAFVNSTISNITIPEGVTSIGGYAFYNCVNLTELILPATLVRIGNNAFNQCPLTTVTCLATNAPALGTSVFNSNIDLLIYPVDSNYSSWNIYFAKMKTLGGGSCGDNVRWKVVGHTLKIYGTGEMTDFTDYPEYTEYVNEITDVEIDEGVTSIGQYAFIEMSNLSNIVLPTTIETIGGGAFVGIATNNTVTARSNAYNFDQYWGNATLIIDDNLERNLMKNRNTFKSVVYNRTFGAGKVGTVVLPFELSEESKSKLTFYTLGEIIGNYLVFEPVAVDNITAGVPYIWENNTSSDVTKLTSVENATVVVETTSVDNESGWRLVGTFDNKNIADKEELQTTYYLSAGKVMNATTSLSISPYRAYFEGPRYDDTFGGGSQEASFGRKMFGIVLRGEEGDGTTVIENVTIDENGELNFDNATYDLSGRRVDENTKGIVIKNGKKVLVK